MNMCKAIGEIKEEGRLEGIQVLVTTLQELGHSNDFILEKIINKFAVSEDEAKKYI